MREVRVHSVCGASHLTQGHLIALKQAIDANEVVAMPCNRALRMRRVNPQVKSGIGLKQLGIGFDQSFKLVARYLQRLISTRFAFSARCVEHVQDEIWRPKAFHPCGNDLVVSRRHTGKQPTVSIRWCRNLKLGRLRKDGLTTAI